MRVACQIKKIIQQLVKSKDKTWIAVTETMMVLRAKVQCHISHMSPVAWIRIFKTIEVLAWNKQVSLVKKRRK